VIAGVALWVPALAGTVLWCAAGCLVIWWLERHGR